MKGSRLQDALYFSDQMKSMGLIAALKNKSPVPEDFATKEELYNLPTAEYVHRRGGFLNRQLTVYHVAFHACADLGNVEAIVVDGNSKDEKYPDIFIVMQIMSPKMGSDLLLIAFGEKTGGYTTANYIWDLIQAQKITLSLHAVEAYYNGLKVHEIPKDDPRLLHVSRTFDSLRTRFGTGPGRSY
ncbi:hypothetical protein FEM48_ZijujUnG0086800 [Ziziphus jujuba var. spinosa]|uniref:Uncharacterized protein n=1 Tax=Ziziphus jujuba var. spinosa TaxID=714518 RepID=A0A978U8K9_ZIZJJ|nr:hypothetical protein FEM48_ZijujUnG0086800 [Ziziphus jujuba var. spinosa]